MTAQPSTDRGANKLAPAPASVSGPAGYNPLSVKGKTMSTPNPTQPSAALPPPVAALPSLYNATADKNKNTYSTAYRYVVVVSRVHLINRLQEILIAVSMYTYSFGICVLSAFCIILYPAGHK